MPSEILHLDDPYDSYCLDEACAFIMGRLDKGDEFHVQVHFRTPSEMYKQILEGVR